MASGTTPTRSTVPACAVAFIALLVAVMFTLAGLARAQDMEQCDYSLCWRAKEPDNPRWQEAVECNCQSDTGGGLMSIVENACFAPAPPCTPDAAVGTDRESCVAAAEARRIESMKSFGIVPAFEPWYLAIESRADDLSVNAAFESYENFVAGKTTDVRQIENVVTSIVNGVRDKARDRAAKDMPAPFGAFMKGDLAPRFDKMNTALSYATLGDRAVSMWRFEKDRDYRRDLYSAELRVKVALALAGTKNWNAQAQANFNFLVDQTLKYRDWLSDPEGWPAHQAHLAETCGPEPGPMLSPAPDR